MIVLDLNVFWTMFIFFKIFDISKFFEKVPPKASRVNPKKLNFVLNVDCFAPEGPNLILNTVFKLIMQKSLVCVRFLKP